MKTDLIEEKISNFRWSKCLQTYLLLCIFEIIFYIYFLPEPSFKTSLNILKPKCPHFINVCCLPGKKSLDISF